MRRLMSGLALSSSRAKLPKWPSAALSILAVMALAAGQASSAPAAAKPAVNKVEVHKMADRVVVNIDVTGSITPKVGQSQSGGWITVDLPAAYAAKPVRQAIGLDVIKAVKAGWFTSRPAKTRIAVTTTARLPFDLERVEGGDFELTVWRSKALKAAASSARKETSDLAPLAKAPVTQKADATPVPAPVKRTAVVRKPIPHISEAILSNKPKDAQTVFAPEPVQIASAAAIPSVSSDIAPVVKVAGSQEEMGSSEVEVSVTEPVQPERSVKQTINLPAGTDPAAAVRQAMLGVAEKPRIEPTVSLNFVGTDINDVLKALSMQGNTNIITGADVKGQITVALNDVSFEKALASITRLSGFRWSKEDNTYFVGTDRTIGSVNNNETTESAIIVASRMTAPEIEAAIKGQYPGLSVTIPGTAKDSTRVLVAGLPSEIKNARDMIRTMEAGMSQGRSGIVYDVYNIRYAKAGSLILILDQLVPGVKAAPGAVPEQVGNNIQMSGKTGEGKENAPESGPAEGPGQAPGGEGADVKETDAKFTGMVRTLILSGTPDDISEAKKVLAKVDTPVPQIVIEAKVVDMNVTNADKLGILYNWSGNGYTVGVINNANGVDAIEQPINLDPTLRMLPNRITATLEAEIKNGNGNLLASPRVSAMEGLPANIFIGDRIRYIESIQDTQSGITVTTGEIEAGIKLVCVGHVDGLTDRITLKIMPEVSTPTLNTDTKTGITLPIIATRTVDTTVRVKNGETIVIGGLINERELRTLTKIPFLGDLPVLGNLFRHRSETKEKRELMIFITCTLQVDKD